jgi:hypothetical protein
MQLSHPTLKITVHVNRPLMEACAALVGRLAVPVEIFLNINFVRLFSLFTYVILIMRFTLLYVLKICSSYLYFPEVVLWGDNL